MASGWGSPARQETICQWNKLKKSAEPAKVRFKCSPWRPIRYKTAAVYDLITFDFWQLVETRRNEKSQVTERGIAKTDSKISFLNNGKRNVSSKKNLLRQIILPFYGITKETRVVVNTKLITDNRTRRKNGHTFLVNTRLAELTKFPTDSI